MGYGDMRVRGWLWLVVTIIIIYIAYKIGYINNI